MTRDGDGGAAASTRSAGWLLSSIGALAVAYFVSARLGLSFAAVHGVATTVWPPTGISIAALILGGPRLWPGVLCGAIAANLSVGVPWWVAVAIGAGNTVEAVFGASILRRFAVRRLDALREVLILFTAAVASPMISATIGVGSTIAGGVVPLTDSGEAWLAWWFGDTLGALMIAPLLLTWTAGALRETVPRPAETTLCLVSIAIVGSMIFGATASVPPLAYVIFPFVIWSALRLGQAVVSATVVLAAALAVEGALHGVGPFTAPTVLHGLFYVQLFMAIVAITGLSLGAVITERAHAEASLQAARNQLQLVTATMAAPGDALQPRPALSVGERTVCKMARTPGRRNCRPPDRRDHRRVCLRGAPPAHRTCPLG
jgi:integral membrane sensor domain MASE1